MMPWGHFAVVFLPYLAYRILKYRDLPSRRATILLLVATQLPDLIDKPLAWVLYLLPSGRSLGHSFLFAIPLVVLVSIVASRRDRPVLGVLFTLGYLSHVLGDVYKTLLNVPPDQWATTYVSSLYWPLLPLPPGETMAFLPHFTRVDPTRYSQVAVGLVLFAGIFAAPEIRAVVEKHRRPTDATPEDVPTAATDGGFDTDDPPAGGSHPATPSDPAARSD